jgi:hypothetical protein
MDVLTAGTGAMRLAVGHAQGTAAPCGANHTLGTRFGAALAPLSGRWWFCAQCARGFSTLATTQCKLWRPISGDILSW